jgi:hypothetical protein
METINIILSYYFGFYRPLIVFEQHGYISELFYLHNVPRCGEWFCIEELSDTRTSMATTCNPTQLEGYIVTIIESILCCCSCFIFLASNIFFKEGMYTMMMIPIELHRRRHHYCRYVLDNHHHRRKYYYHNQYYL